MNLFTLTALELRRYWSKPKNYFSIFIIIALSIGGTLFINGVLSFLIGNLTEIKLNLLSYSQLSSAFSIAWLVIILYYCVSQLSSFITLDYTTNIDQVVFSKPITARQYVWSKTIYAVIQCLIFGLIGAMAVIGISIYFNKENYLLKDQVPNIINFLVYNVIPNQIILALFVSWLSLKLKNKGVQYYTYGAFILLPIIIDGLFGRLDGLYPFMTWLDPTGSLVISNITKYYTASEINTFNVNILFIVNRLVWILGMVIVTWFFAHKFTFEPQANKEKKLDNTPLIFEHTKPTLHTPNQFTQLMTITRFNLINAITKPAFLVITFVMAGYYSFYAFTNFSVEKIPLYPSTDSVLLWFSSATIFYMIIYIGYRLTAIFDSEKSTNTTSMVMSKPVSHVNIYLSKILCVFLEVAISLGLVTLLAIISQFIFQSPVKAPIILIVNYLVYLSLYLSIIVIAFFIITLFNRSKLAYIGVFFVFASSFGLLFFSAQYPILRTKLLNVLAGSIVRVNDFAGIGYGLDEYVILRGFWFGVTMIALIGIILIALRRDNLNRVIFSFIPKTKVIKYFIPLTIIATIATGIGVKYIENLNPSEEVAVKFADNYNSLFNQDIKKPIPTITDVVTNYDLYPNEAKFTITGNYKMINNNQVNIEDLIVDFEDIKFVKNITFSVPIVDESKETDYAQKVKKQDAVAAKKFKFLTPIKPNEVINMQFELGYKRNWFSDYDNLDNRIIQKNGTFLNSQTLPTIGFNFGKVLDPNSKLYLPEVQEFINSTDTSKNLFSNYSNYVNLTTTINTQSDQLGIAPGTKISEETLSDGRKKYVYNSPKMLFFANVLSSRLDVKTETHEGVKIEIFHHPDHTVNLEQIMNGAKDTLTYMKSNITPYPLDYLRIIEFGSGQYAQSFSGTVAIGDYIFIAKTDIEDVTKLNYPYYVTAHEVAHQWWGHQVTAAQGKGSAFITESLAEYSSNRVVANKYGEEALLAYKKNNLDVYLSSRKLLGQEKNEKPLGEVGYYDNQGFIHYNKGSMVLDNISTIMTEKGLNSILKNYVENNKSGPPFADYRILVNQILSSLEGANRQYANESLNEVVVYDNSITKFNTVEKEGQFVSTLDLNLIKKKIVNGEYIEVPFEAQEYTIDTYAINDNNSFKDGQFISRQIVKAASGNQQVVITTKLKPEKFILDKDIKYIDRNLKNNYAGGKPQSFIDLLSDTQAITDALIK